MLSMYIYIPFCPDVEFLSNLRLHNIQFEVEKLYVHKRHWITHCMSSYTRNYLIIALNIIHSVFGHSVYMKLLLLYIINIPNYIICSYLLQLHNKQFLYLARLGLERVKIEQPIMFFECMYLCNVMCVARIFYFLSMFMTHPLTYVGRKWCRSVHKYLPLYRQ